MSRRLVNRAGRSAAASSPPRHTTALPEYEPQACPLDESARRALNELSNNRAVLPYDIQLKESVRHLGISVGDMHERLRAQQERLARQRATRESKGLNKGAEEERLEEHIAKLEQDVQSLTSESERAMRYIIDKRVELEDENTVLSELYATAATQNPHTQQDGEQDDDTQLPPVSSTLQAYEDGRQQELAKFTDMSMHQRYALNNDYAGFKKMWHDAAVGEDGPPLPDASKWFRSNGQPVISGLGGDFGLGADTDGSDDDIAVAREVVSLKCPLTLRVMQEPYSSNKCKHTFEKSALLSYLAPGPQQCPQTGCDQSFTRADFDRDFYLDRAMLRRIERAEAAHASDEDMDDDDRNLDGDSELAVRAQKRRRSSRPPKAERI